MRLGRVKTRQACLRSSLRFVASWSMLTEMNRSLRGGDIVHSWSSCHISLLGVEQALSPCRGLRSRYEGRPFVPIGTLFPNDFRELC